MLIKSNFIFTSLKKASIQPFIAQGICTAEKLLFVQIQLGNYFALLTYMYYILRFFILFF